MRFFSVRMGLALTLVGSAAAHADIVVPPGPYAVAVTNNLRYATPGPDRFNLCLPQPAAGQWAGPFPAVIIIHGGAWVGGDKDGDPNYAIKCRALASNGIAAININYRLIKSGDKTTYWPAQIVDGQAAVRFLRANAKTFNINPAFFCGSGDSAGGQIVQYLGYLYSLMPGDIAGQNPDVSPKLDCVISEFGPSQWGPGQPAGAPTTKTLDLLAADAARPVPDTLLVQGTKDTQVPPINSIAVYNWMQEHHRSADYISYIGGHEFSGLIWNTQLVLIYQQEIAWAIKTFKKYGALPS